MLNIELTSYGFDETLKEIRIDLESVLGENVSKKRKDAAICKTLGAVNALWNLIEVKANEVVIEDECSKGGYGGGNSYYSYTTRIAGSGDKCE